jgi:hypothetical protein
MSHSLISSCVTCHICGYQSTRRQSGTEISMPAYEVSACTSIRTSSLLRRRQQHPSHRNPSVDVDICQSPPVIVFWSNTPNKNKRTHAPTLIGFLVLELRNRVVICIGRRTRVVERDDPNSVVVFTGSIPTPILPKCRVVSESSLLIVVT